MKLLLLGATGRLGRELVGQGLARGHEITALVRNPEKLEVDHGALRVVRGDVLEGDGLASAAKGQDAVVSALGVGASLRPRGLIARSMPMIVRAMESQGVRRLIFTSGVILKPGAVPLVPRLLMRLLMRDLAADKKAGEDLLRETGLAWTLVYPVRLTNGPRSGKYRSGEQLVLRGFPTVSRADVADLILRLLEEPGSIRKDILISN
jgi:putative NADH-flavin reductase